MSDGMKRRRFLGLFGSTLAVPLVPMPALAKAGYSQAAWNTAVGTARSSAAISVGGMARLLNMTPAATEAMMRDMVSKGILGPLTGPRHGGVWAVSRVMKAGNIAALHKAKQIAQADAKPQTNHLSEDARSETPGWIAHLRNICTQNGMPLSERCFS